MALISRHYLWVACCLLAVSQPVNGDNLWNRFKAFLSRAIGGPQSEQESVTTTLSSPPDSNGNSPGYSIQRIYRGWEARNWAHHAGLCVDGKVVCGASLIHESWIVTAAHCIDSYIDGANVNAAATKRRFRVKLGAHQLNSNSCLENSPEKFDSLFGEQLLDVAEIRLHPHFENPLSHSNDMALLKLATPAEFTETVYPIQLQLRVPPIRPNETCVVMGWGTTESGYSSDVLLETEVTILSHAACLGLHGTEKVDQTMFCAGQIGAPGPNTCEGDSGGGLVCEKDGEWVLAGVASWGYRCFEQNSTGVYANMDRLTGFITEIIEPNHRISDLKVVSGREPNIPCPVGYHRAQDNLQSVKGSTRYVYLCFKRRSAPRYPITSLSIATKGYLGRPDCPRNSAFYVEIPRLRKRGSLPSLYLCYTRSSRHAPVVDIVVARRLWEFVDERNLTDYINVAPPVAIDIKRAIFIAYKTKPL